ncbi:DUF4276 family protein [Mycobacterium yunnanensis]|uniref:DUF4276 family protein n=1 Tax=Mycobacterium yunnanensis TaxID=368477 RepID=A0A9X2Z8Q2_9MYCO|nr:DUF4276 family protein [Mycobacterium yunnanensis]MCV7423926.1 DUF4276 family protein [Mycobacterium yunnanensis]
MTAQSGDPHIEVIVEGKADFNAIPVLLRNHLYAQNEYRDLLGKPIATKGISNATKANGIEGFVVTAACRPGCRAILIVIDSDDHCIAEMAEELTIRLDGLVEQPVVLAFAERTYEDWLYASVETLGIGDCIFVASKSGISAIETALRAIGESYSKPLWQPKLTHRIDIALARSRSTSLSRLLDRFDALLPLLNSP